MASRWPQNDPSDRPLHFIKESIPKELASLGVVVANRSIDVFLKKPVVDDVHRSLRKLLRMSSQVQDAVGSTSNSLARRIASSIPSSSSSRIAGSEVRRLAANCARWSWGKSRTLAFIS